MKSTPTSMPFTNEQLSQMLANAPDSDKNSNDDWSNAVVATSYEDLQDKLAQKRSQQMQTSELEKRDTNIPLSPEVLSFFKSQGKNWQTKIDEVLMNYIQAQH